jgi:hypothetical protein
MASRVKVTGDLFHPVIPEGAIYVGRSGPNRPASPYANPFRLKLALARGHRLRPYLDAGFAKVTGTLDTSKPLYDVLPVVTPAVATAAFRAYLLDRNGLLVAARLDLRGADIACWCHLPEPGKPDYCHGAVLLELVNAP